MAREVERIVASLEQKASDALEEIESKRKVEAATIAEKAQETASKVVRPGRFPQLKKLTIRIDNIKNRLKLYHGDEYGRITRARRRKPDNAR